MAQMVPKTSYDHIVLLTDLTSRSNGALSYSRAFAKYYGCRLTLLHVLAKPALRRFRPHALNVPDAETARMRLQSIADGFEASDIDVHIHLQENTSRRNGIHDCLRRLHPDLIIQGTAGIDDPRRAVLGSFAESVFRRSRIPVLTVGMQVKPFTDKNLHFDRILFVTNFGSQATNASLYALSLAEEFQARVTLCHVYGGATAMCNKEDVEQHIKHALEQRITREVRDWCDPESLVVFGDIDAELRLLMQQQKPDLIITAAHGLGALGTRGKPGTAFRIVANAECPVLTILGEPVKAEHPLYPDNCPEMIAYC